MMIFTCAAEDSPSSCRLNALMMILASAAAESSARKHSRKWSSCSRVFLFMPASKCKNVQSLYHFMTSRGAGALHPKAKKYKMRPPRTAVY
eukprot:1161716-Pelagomonas_calceolata.AAC.4